MNRNSNYRFSYEKMLSLSGNTAPYMMYAYARIRGIERRATRRIGCRANRSHSRARWRARVQPARRERCCEGDHPEPAHRNASRPTCRASGNESPRICCAGASHARSIERGERTSGCESSAQSHHCGGSSEEAGDAQGEEAEESQAKSPHPGLVVSAYQ
jgi:hypothetical protein